MSNPAPVATVNDHGLERLRSGHPWVYNTDLVRLQGEVAPAQAVVVRDARGRRLGAADYSPNSKIALRLLTRDAEQCFDADFFRQRIRAALAYRQRVVRDSDAYRVVWGEADGLPGLVVDRYREALSVQILTFAMEARRDLLLRLLEEELRPAVLVERNDSRVRLLEGLELRSGLLKGASSQVEIALNGLSLRLDLLAGQKTGGFLDQRENWPAPLRYLSPEAEALDVFTYQGGFALHLARHCRHVEAVDISRDALEHADANAQRNGLANIDWIEANAFDLLRQYDDDGRRFDVVVLDPPAFAKSRSALATAERGYKEINLRAMKILRPGGMLVTCSCSHHLAESRLLDIVADAANDAHRTVTVVERRTQSLDHPILLTVPETYYLKCVLAILR